MYDASTQWRFERELKNPTPAVFVYFDLELLSFLLNDDTVKRYILRGISFRKYIPHISKYAMRIVFYHSAYFSSGLNQLIINLSFFFTCEPQNKAFTRGSYPGISYELWNKKDRCIQRHTYTDVKFWCKIMNRYLIFSVQIGIPLKQKLVNKYSCNTRARY